jgi:hypothetical protein
MRWRVRTFKAASRNGVRADLKRERPRGHVDVAKQQVLDVAVGGLGADERRVQDLVA